MTSLDLLAEIRETFGGAEFRGEARRLEHYGSSKFETLLGHGHVLRRRLSPEERAGTNSLYAYRLSEPKHSPACWYEVETGWHCAPDCPVQTRLPL